MDRDWMAVLTIWAVLAIALVTALCIRIAMNRQTIRTHVETIVNLHAALDFQTKETEWWSALAVGHAATANTADRIAKAAQDSATEAQLEVDGLKAVLETLTTDLQTARRHNNQASELIARLRKAYDALTAQHDALSRAYVAACRVESKE